MALLRVPPLPVGALAASAVFHADVLPGVLSLIPPLLFRGGAGGGGSQADALLTDSPHPNPSPEPQAGEAQQMTLVFPPADHTHRAWRLAVVQGLARDHAPLRINALESDDEPAIAAALEYLAAAPGVTGQYLPLDATGAGSAV